MSFIPGVPSTSTFILAASRKTFVSEALKFIDPTASPLATAVYVPRLADLLRLKSNTGASAAVVDQVFSACPP